MVTVNQIQSGFARYVDVQLSGAFDGWQKAVVLAGGTLIAKNIPNLFVKYANHPAAIAFGVLGDDNAIDIDALYEALIEHIGQDKLPIKLPGIGTLKIGRDDIDALCRYIKEA